jgi:hypothetical protein
VTPQAESDDKPNSKKSTLPSSPLVNENSKDPSIKTPVTVGEVQEVKPIEPIPITATAVPMSNMPPPVAIN